MHPSNVPRLLNKLRDTVFMHRCVSLVFCLPFFRILGAVDSVKRWGDISLNSKLNNFYCLVLVGYRKILNTLFPILVADESVK